MACSGLHAQVIGRPAVGCGVAGCFGANSHSSAPPTSPTQCSMNSTNKVLVGITVLVLAAVSGLGAKRVGMLQRCFLAFEHALALVCAAGTAHSLQLRTCGLCDWP